MAYFEIPLSSENELFQVELSSRVWLIRARWSNASESGWVLDWFDENEAAILFNMPLVTGANISEGYEYLNIPSPLFVVGEELPPGIDSLGDDYFLIFDDLT